MTVDRLPEHLWPCDTFDKYRELLKIYLDADAREDDNALLANHNGQDYVIKFDTVLIDIFRGQRETLSVMSQEKFIEQITTHLTTQTTQNPSSILSEALALNLCRHVMSKISTLFVCPFEVVEPPSCFGEADKPRLSIGLSAYEPTYEGLNKSISREQNIIDVELKLAIQQLFIPLDQREANEDTQALSARLQARDNLAVEHGMLLYGWALLCYDIDVIGDRFQNIGTIIKERNEKACKIDAGMADFFKDFEADFMQSAGKKLKFFFDFATQKEKIISLLPIVFAKEGDLEKFVRADEYFKQFTTEEQNTIVDNLKKRQGFIKKHFQENISTKQLLAAIVKLAIKRYSSIRIIKNSYYLTLEKQDQLTAKYLFHLVSEQTGPSGTIHPDSFICHVLQIAKELELLDKLFEDLPAEVKNGIDNWKSPRASFQFGFLTTYDDSLKSLRDFLRKNSPPPPHPQHARRV